MQHILGLRRDSSRLYKWSICRILFLNGYNLVKNQYHNGHPDLIPAGMFPKNSVQHSHVGIEVKASRYQSGWQGHNLEDTWLMVFVFDSNRPSDAVQGIQPKPFRFIKVVGASLTKNDWSFSGRSEISRRTITASVTKSGYQKQIYLYFLLCIQKPIDS